jgi:hypothetical protein
MASQQWYLAQGQTIFGPMSASDLQALAASGRLRPDDRLTTDRQTWYFAISVNGLFPEPPAPPLVPPPAVAQMLPPRVPPRVPPPVRNIPSQTMAPVGASTGTSQVSSSTSRFYSKRTSRSTVIVGALVGLILFVGAASFLVIGKLSGAPDGNKKTSKGQDRATKVAEVSQEKSRGEKSGKAGLTRDESALPNSTSRIPSPKDNIPPSAPSIIPADSSSTSGRPVPRFPLTWERLLEMTGPEGPKTRFFKNPSDKLVRVEVTYGLYIIVVVEQQGHGFAVATSNDLALADFMTRPWFTPTESDKLIDLYADYVASERKVTTESTQVGRYSVKLGYDQKYPNMPCFMLMPIGQ